MVSISQLDINSLNPGRWLTDTIITFQTEQLIQRIEGQHKFKIIEVTVADWIAATPYNPI